MAAFRPIHPAASIQKLQEEPPPPPWSGWAWSKSAGGLEQDSRLHGTHRSRPKSWSQRHLSHPGGLDVLQLGQEGQRLISCLEPREAQEVSCLVMPFLPSPMAHYLSHSAKSYVLRYSIREQTPLCSTPSTAPIGACQREIVLTGEWN